VLCTASSVFQSPCKGFFIRKCKIAHPRQPELVGKLNIAQKQINADLKLQDNVLDTRLIAFFNAGAADNRQVRGDYTFAGVRQIAVATRRESCC